MSSDNIIEFINRYRLEERINYDQIIDVLEFSESENLKEYISYFKSEKKQIQEMGVKQAE